MKTRYTLTPHMREYDRIGQAWLPFLMYFHAPNYHSEVLNTDFRGFRVTYKGQDKIEGFKNIDKLPVCLLVGGSFVFGVGATNDRYTIPSVMNSNTDCLWLNFGGRAFSSTQEFLLFLFFHQQIKNIKKIIILSGLNNLMLQYLCAHDSEIGSFFFQNQYNEKMNTIYPLSLKRSMLKMALNPFFGNEIDYAKISANELKKRLLCKKNIIKTGGTDNDEYLKERLLNLLERDIANWKLFAEALGIELHYVLEPMATWINKERTKEESALFAELDEHQGEHWKILKDKIGYNQYLWFSAKLEEICNGAGIRFYDMNSILSGMQLGARWLFVDRAHCTDEGYSIVSKVLCERIGRA